MKVKKILSLLAIGIFISMVATSCASRDHCPGVGSVNQVETSNVG